MEHILSRTENLRQEGSSPFRIGRAQKITVISGARLFRECFLTSLSAATSFEIDDYSSVNEWLAATPPTVNSSLILLAMMEDVSDMLLGSIMERAPGVPIVMAGEREDSEYIYGLLIKGVRGYIPTSLTLDIAIGALQVIRAGGTFASVNCLIARSNQQARSVPEKAEIQHMFTAKQLAVIGAIRKGKANKTIAYELNMCESTVKVHVRNIMKKTNAKNRTQIAFIAGNLIDELQQREKTDVWADPALSSRRV